MPRRYRPEKRVVVPDEKYNNVHASMLINRLMYGGKKSVATRVLYDSFDLIEARTKAPAIEVFEAALNMAQEKKLLMDVPMPIKQMLNKGCCYFVNSMIVL